MTKLTQTSIQNFSHRENRLSQSQKPQKERIERNRKNIYIEKIFPHTKRQKKPHKNTQRTTNDPQACLLINPA